jgi:hypothetical protein
MSDADRAADRDVEIRILADRQFTGRVNRRARFAHHGLGDVAVERLEDAGDELVGLARGRAVADGDQPGVILGDQFLERPAGAFNIVLRSGRVDRCAGDELPRAVDDGELATGAKTGVDADRHLRPRRRGEQQLPEVAGEDGDRLFVGALLERLEHG